MYIVGQEEIDAIARVIRSGALFRYGIGAECDRCMRRTMGATNVACDHHGMNDATLTRRVCSRAAVLGFPGAAGSVSPAAHSFRSAAAS